MLFTLSIYIYNCYHNEHILDNMLALTVTFLASWFLWDAKVLKGSHLFAVLTCRINLIDVWWMAVSPYFKISITVTTFVRTFFIIYTHVYCPSIQNKRCYLYIKMTCSLIWVVSNFIFSFKYMCSNSIISLTWQFW